MSTNYKSPCIKVCQVDWATGWCFGCGRNGSEITNWLRYSEAERDTVLAGLSARLAALKLPLTPEIRKSAADDRAREQRMTGYSRTSS